MHSVLVTLPLAITCSHLFPPVSTHLHVMPPMKRTRSEIDDSDEEEPSLGKQVLPVANLPADFDSEPMDGLQYLFTVR